VPRIYEKIRAGILSQVTDASGAEKAIFNFAFPLPENLIYACTDRPRTDSSQHASASGQAGLFIDEGKLGFDRL
jgi:long-subunit acyl-CoA synthetase (AMP-forming)